MHLSKQYLDAYYLLFLYNAFGLEVRTMMRIDNAILETDTVICKNISRFDDSERGLLSQNILAQLRNFVEYIAEKIYANGDDIDPNDYGLKEQAIKYLQTRGDLRFLYQFHELLQKSASHYTLDENSSERLMLKYYEYLLKIKIFLNDKYRLQVLNNIEDFPLNTDTELLEYYAKIAEKICYPSLGYSTSSYLDRYYIQKIKPFFVNQHIYYEVTFTAANNKVSKFDRVIAFSRYEILSNYAVKLSIRNDLINILGKDMPIQVIDGWSVSIRPCELDNFASIMGSHPKINSGTKEYNALMNYLTETKMPLSEFVVSSEQYYDSVKKKILSQAKISHIFDILDKCRKMILTNRPGCNVIKYLLYHLNNRVIKWQYSYNECSLLSRLNLDYGCIPFDKMPFCTSLRNHNPRIYDLLDCISETGREHELLARYIQNNTETKGMLFTPKKEILGFENIDNLISVYNSNLYLPNHENRKLMIFYDYLYIKGYADDSSYIIQKLRDLASNGIDRYTALIDFWLNKGDYIIDSPEKRDVLRKMFAKSQVALIYGSAGTGKSTLINHISNFYSDYEILFLANTHPAVDNLRRKVTIDSGKFSTIASFISEKNKLVKYDVIIIDECSTVSNSDMRKILEKAEFKILILVGDVYQIESIYFGNWFDIARNFISEHSIFELEKPYRTTNKDLLTVWDRVRNLDIAILEPMVKSNYSVCLDESIFSHAEKDEIILCLNYDGLYGINNINRFLQNSNSNPAIQWGLGLYKVGDPILFNESERFSPLIHNNSKGCIVGIEIEESKIWFEIELDCVINNSDIMRYDFQLLGSSENGNSIIKFSVDKFKSTDEDDDFDIVVPFQVAYAISIHKAQGLEYRSVKIVITNETEERITHNIFYTAITRTKENLKIYWSPETEKSVLGKLIIRESKRDANLLKQLYSL